MKTHVPVSLSKSTNSRPSCDFSLLSHFRSFAELSLFFFGHTFFKESSPCGSSLGLQGEDHHSAGIGEGRPS
eukprot:UN16014